MQTAREGRSAGSSVPGTAIADATVEQAARWGGDWTKQKLDILEHYLNAYTTALRRRHFSLIYVDAFAGTGEVQIRTDNQDYAELVAGSPKRALSVRDKQFDRLVFVDKSRLACQKLRNLKAQHSGRWISIEQSDANSYLKRIELSFHWRGVLFIDPFATELQWSTLEYIAKLERLDTWILFPTMAVQRVLKSQYIEGSYPPNLATALNRVFGSDIWRSIYRRSPQRNFFEDEPKMMERSVGVRDLLQTYKRGLERLFGDRLLDKSKTLSSPNSGPLFEFFFCVGHPSGIRVAKRIAGHLLRDL